MRREYDKPREVNPFTTWRRESLEQDWKPAGGASDSHALLRGALLQLENLDAVFGHRRDVALSIQAAVLNLRDGLDQLRVADGFVLNKKLGRGKKGAVIELGWVDHGSRKSTTRANGQTTEKRERESCECPDTRSRLTGISVR